MVIPNISKMKCPPINRHVYIYNFYNIYANCREPKYHGTTVLAGPRLEHWHLSAVLAPAAMKPILHQRMSNSATGGAFSSSTRTVSDTNDFLVVNTSEIS